ncbi:hypothetical protein [uncultured Gemmiger sp.]|uniref:hypothetical protein n=1 Tax=uncultured Gemmiger sp. TaxID=1623490 RepID=UPI002665A7F2|nr:hypothetical protein [uncultured Gemmiger sp.]
MKINLLGANGAGASGKERHKKVPFSISLSEKTPASGKQQKKAKIDRFFRFYQMTPAQYRNRCQ